ncbi:MFS transporter [Bradyrhizobium sp. Tv2a-2]|uniref:MFS transporter n=1 Tax=Bradyrhizobium sp. Tv2a-2 TaxID=113395 RepID=UPI00041A9161|nr:MFS transporter [Bradyrhizobium sp. Tv2a-2]
MRKRSVFIWFRGLPRGYLALLGGQTVSVLGSQVTLLALPLTAISLFGAGPSEVGLLLACGKAPYLVLGLFAGVMVDRLPHRPILLIANLLMALTLATIPLLAGLGHLGMVQLYTANTLLGVAAVIVDVAYLACVPTMLDRSLLVRAQSSLQVGRAGALATGPFLAGWLVSVVSAPMAILADSSSFVFAAALIFLVPAGTADRPAVQSRRLLDEIAEGLSAVFGNRRLRSVTLANSTFVFCYNAYSAVFVLYLTKELGLGGGTIGVVLGIGAFGGILGAVISPWVGRVIGLGPVLMVGLALSAAGMALATLLTEPAWAAIACVALSQFLLWVGQDIFNVQQVPIRYALAPQWAQGRVNASIRTLVWGMATLGALAGGASGAGPGLRATLFASSLLGLASVLWIWWSPLRHTQKLAQLTTSLIGGKRPLGDKGTKRSRRSAGSADAVASRRAWSRLLAA